MFEYTMGTITGDKIGGLLLLIGVVAGFLILATIMFLVMLGEQGGIKENKKEIVTLLICWVVLLTGVNVDKTASYYTSKDKTIVSSVPPTITTDVYGSGFFIGFTVGSDNKLVYRLREQLAPNTYKDFLVKHGLTIIEDASLKKTAIFSQKYQCNKYVTTLRIPLLITFKQHAKVCTFKSQQINVPIGAVVKNISI